MKCSIRGAAGLRRALAVAGVASVLVGCGGNGKPADTPSPAPTRTLSVDHSTDMQDAAIMAEESNPFDEEFAQRILERGQRKVRSCPATAGAPAEEGTVEVVFDGTKGRVVDVILTYPFNEASESAQACIKNGWIGEHVPPFDGKKTLPFKVHLDPSDKAPDGG